MYFIQKSCDLYFFQITEHGHIWAELVS